MLKKSRGFTLIELIVTFALIALVTAVSAGVMTQMWGLFRSYNIRRDMHDAEHQLRQVVRGIQRDFRFGSIGEISFDDIGEGWFQFPASTFESGIRGETTVMYSLEPHHYRDGYFRIARSFSGYHTMFWDENSPVGGFPVNAVRDFEVVPLDINANVITTDGPEITHLRIRIWTGFAQRVHAINPLLVDLDEEGNHTGPLDPFEMKIAVNRFLN